MNQIALFDSIDKYKHSEDETKIVYSFPLSVKIDINKDFLLSKYENIIEEYGCGDNFYNIILIKKVSIYTLEVSW